MLQLRSSRQQPYTVWTQLPGPSPSNNGTTEMQVWPDSIPPTVDRVASFPLDQVCTWNLPIIDIGADGTTPAACNADYTLPNGASYNFWNLDPQTRRSCDIYTRVNEPRGTLLLGATQGRTDLWIRPGSALFYARSIVYPKGTCTSGSGVLTC